MTLRYLTVVAIALGCMSLSAQAQGYEVWASDQSNSVPGQSGAGLKGSYLWIWKQADIEAQVAGGPAAQPVACARNNRGKAPGNVGPCDLLDVFPQDLLEVDADGVATGNRLADLEGFGRLHGMIADPQGQYVNANIFAPGGGYVGVIDTSTKEAIALFRVTGTNVGNGDARSVHMSFWSSDGSQILIANLNGKVLERIDVTRNGSGKIKDLAFNRSASLGVGKGMAVTAEATSFTGKNAHGRKMIGRITGSYDMADFGDLTPAGLCREDGCASGQDGGRPNNVIICPITSDLDNTYITMGGGGLLVADTTATPMRIVGEYSNAVINGAGCGGVQVADRMWINAGVSASGAGAVQSTFTVYALDDAQLAAGGNGPDTPAPVLVYADPGNTATGGNAGGVGPNGTGQLPGVTTRRDSHGMDVTTDGRFMHIVDRLQNVVESIDTTSLARVTYDLTSADGKGNGTGGCATQSVSDDPGLPGNDPAPDLMEVTPDNRFLVIALRGPAPVSVQHSAQGSCPGVGIVALSADGSTGAMVTVLRTTNTVDTAPAAAPGGHVYTGAERSDVHGAIVVSRP